MGLVKLSSDVEAAQFLQDEPPQPLCLLVCSLMYHSYNCATARFWLWPSGKSLKRPPLRLEVDLVEFRRDVETAQLLQGQPAQPLCLLGSSLSEARDQAFDLVELT